MFFLDDLFKKLKREFDDDYVDRLNYYCMLFKYTVVFILIMQIFNAYLFMQISRHSNPFNRIRTDTIFEAICRSTNSMLGAGKLSKFDDANN
jgi:hypothetical protein